MDGRTRGSIIGAALLLYLALSIKNLQDERRLMNDSGNSIGFAESDLHFLIPFVESRGNLLLPCTLHSGQAFRKLLVQRSTSSTLADFGKPRVLAFRFGVNERCNAVAIFVAKLFGIEFSF